VSADALFYSIMVLDIEAFGKRVNPRKGDLREIMYELVQEVVGAAGLRWEELGISDTGDGLLLIVPPDTSPALLAGAMLHELDARLQGVNPPGGLRLRVSLHLGLAHQDARGWYGEAVDFAFRLVETQQLRDVLTAAEGARTVFITSEEVYQAVVRHGYKLIDPAKFGPIRFIPKHQQEVRAWVYVPGRPFPPGLPEVSDQASDRAAPAPPAAETATPTVQNQNTATVVKGDQVGVKQITVNNPGSVRL
jgi:hypothetical protein